MKEDVPSRRKEKKETPTRRLYAVQPIGFVSWTECLTDWPKKQDGHSSGRSGVAGKTSRSRSQQQKLIKKVRAAKSFLLSSSAAAAVLRVPITMTDGRAPSPIPCHQSHMQRGRWRESGIKYSNPKPKSRSGSGVWGASGSGEALDLPYSHWVGM
jgi:hypothetical protein